MIVYRRQHREVEPAGLLRNLEHDVLRLGSHPGHPEIVSLLIDLGVAESGVLDAVNPNLDDVSDLDGRFGAAALLAGHLLVTSWRGRRQDLAIRGAELAGQIDEIRSLPLPARCSISDPEGYAQYGVWPEAYAASTLRLVRELRPTRAVCLGLRSIGTSLSAVVAATLQVEGCPIERHTLRPRGHPFERRPALGPRLAARLSEASERSHFLIVDEGPGLSGSSFAGVAEALSALGIPDERIVFLPSWDTDGTSLRSEVARRRWGRHPRFVTTYRPIWPAPAWPSDLPNDADLTDFSAGRWRRHLLPAGRAWPAVHPQHERRKVVAGRRWYAFAGLGRFGARTLELQAALADARLSPRPFGLDQGMLCRKMVRATPLTAAAVDTATLARVAEYLAYRARCHPADADERGELVEMVLLNVGEAGGAELARLVRRRLRTSGFPGHASPIALDGRMQPHEWLRTSTGILKVDATDHHADHFYPGTGDVAWDLAGAMVELELGDDGRATLVRQYRAQSRDRDITRRLPGYLLAYLAFRIGYAGLAEETLAGSDDGRRFARLKRRYVATLERELGAGFEAAAGA
jgi:hypothetical protein